MNIPFSEEIQGWPVWRIQVDDPNAAGAANVELAHRYLDFPQGGVMALCLKVYDHPGRPAQFHHALAFGSLEFLTLTRHKGVLLVFEKKGWMSDAQKPLSVDFTDYPALGEGQSALPTYLEAYRRLQSKHGNSESIWDAIQQELSPAVAVAARRNWWPYVAALLALLGLGAYFAFFR